MLRWGRPGVDGFGLAPTPLAEGGGRREGGGKERGREGGREERGGGSSSSSSLLLLPPPSSSFDVPSPLGPHGAWLVGLPKTGKYLSGYEQPMSLL